MIDESVKWKLEALARKQEDRLAEAEFGLDNMRRAVAVVTEECTT